MAWQWRPQPPRQATRPRRGPHRQDAKARAHQKGDGDGGEVEAIGGVGEGKLEGGWDLGGQGFERTGSRDFQIHDQAEANTHTR